MSHVDEGRLHAYLDALGEGTGAAEGGREPQGAAGSAWRELERHLADCAECRARLEEARRIRERASAILRGAGPREIHVPPFEEIRARADTVRAAEARMTQARRLRTIAWAATVVIAAGVGWYARGTIPREATPELSAPEPAVVADAVRAAAPAVEEPRETARRAEPAPAPTEHTAGPRVAAEPAPIAAARHRIESLDQVIVAAAEEHDTVAAAPWYPVTPTEAGDALSGAVYTIPGLPVVAHESGVVDGAPAIRVIQSLPTGVEVALIQQAADVLGRREALRARAAAPAPAAVGTDSVLSVSVLRDGVRVTLRAPLALDSLRALAERIRP